MFNRTFSSRDCLVIHLTARKQPTATSHAGFSSKYIKNVLMLAFIFISTCNWNLFLFFLLSFWVLSFSPVYSQYINFPFASFAACETHCSQPSTWWMPRAFQPSQRLRGGLAISCKSLNGLEVVNNGSAVRSISGVEHRTEASLCDLDSGPWLFTLTDRLSHTDWHKLFFFFPFPQPFTVISQ